MLNAAKYAASCCRYKIKLFGELIETHVNIIFDDYFVINGLYEASLYDVLSHQNIIDCNNNMLITFIIDDFRTIYNKKCIKDNLAFFNPMKYYPKTLVNFRNFTCYYKLNDFLCLEICNMETFTLKFGKRINIDINVDRYHKEKSIKGTSNDIGGIFSCSNATFIMFKKDLFQILSLIDVHPDIDKWFNDHDTAKQFQNKTLQFTQNVQKKCFRDFKIKYK